MQTHLLMELCPLYLNGKDENIWANENDQTILATNPDIITPCDTWWIKTTENGATYYVNSEGKTSKEVKPREII